MDRKLVDPSRIIKKGTKYMLSSTTIWSIYSEFSFHRRDDQTKPGAASDANTQTGHRARPRMYTFYFIM